MKYIITESQYKKALNEQGLFLVDLDELSDEEQIKEIIRRKVHIEKLLPKIIKYFEIKYRGELEKITLEDKSTQYGSLNFGLEYKRIDFYFNEAILPNRGYEITSDLRDVFDIDISMYAVPLSIRVLEKTWKISFGR